MNENYFSKKMVTKTDADLEVIISDTTNYVEDARKAAMWELEKRTGKTKIIPEKTEEKVSTEIKSGIQKAESQSSFEFEDDAILDNPKSYLPALYSKKVILLFCILFSTVFGVALLVINLYKLNNQKGVLITLIFGIAYMFLIVVAAMYVTKIPNIALMLNITGGLITSELLWNSQIGKETQFAKRNFLIPLLISLLISVALFVFVFYGDQI